MINQNKWLGCKQCLLVLIGFTCLAFAQVLNAAAIATTTVKQANNEISFTAEGVVEAVKTSLIAPQVQGSITALPVKAGDLVKAGQLLARIDTRMANQQVATNQAQVRAAQAQLSAASREYERKQRLFEKKYISQAALERAESDYKTAEAQTKAQLALTGISNVEAGLHTIYAPYAGIVAEVMTEVGGMAMPGQPILAMYDIKGFRVTVNVPQRQLANLKAGASIKVQVPAATETERSITSTQMLVLPTADVVSNMMTVRVSLPQNLTSVKPGMFARALFQIKSTKGAVQIYIPMKSVIRRSELVAVYVIDKQGNPQLRQVRLGRNNGENIEVLAGLQVGELLALDPFSAINTR